jgi:PPE-repeat protein
MAAASSYESALAAMVPTAVIAPNRAQLAALARANCLGHTSAAVAEIEAVYERMWAQDTSAMYRYARDSADASTLTPFAPPPTTAGPGRAGAALTRGAAARKAIAAQQVVSAGDRVIATIPAALQSLCSSPLTTFDASLARCRRRRQGSAPCPRRRTSRSPTSAPSARAAR